MSSSSSELRATPLADAVRRILTADDVDLPVLPEVAGRLLQLTNDVNCEPRDLVEVIRRDQSLSAHLLRIANSSLYSTGQTVSSIQQTIARLGLLRVREVVILIHCQTRVFDVAGFETPVRESFRRSLAAAAFAQEIARIRRRNVEEAFLAGLLHDIGRPVLLQALADQRRQGQLQADDAELLEAVEAHRIQLATRLIQEWELPDRLAQVVAHQQTPLEAQDGGGNACILNLAIDLAQHLVQGTFPDADQPLNHPMIPVLNLYPENVTAICAQRRQILDWVNSTS